jgi:large subunit ribosomal protein L3
MNKLLIGKKVGMTQVFTEDKELVPVTVIEAGPCTVTQVKTVATDGYDAVQIGFGTKKEKNSSKAELNHARKAGVEAPREVCEIRTDGAPSLSLGDQLAVDMFADERKVDVIGTTKGRGFAGVMKRWDFAGGPASHGSMFHRRGGSYGMRQFPGHVWPGKKMPGHYGVDRRTVQNLVVVKIIPEKNLILVRGSVPGANGSTVVVRGAIKKRKGI